MINRRIIRTKVLQTLFAHYHSQNNSLAMTEKELEFNYKKFYDLYFYILLLQIDINDYARRKQEKAKKRYMPTDEDLNPNSKFVNNKLIAQLRDNLHIRNHLQETKLSWVNNPELIKNLYNELVANERFVDYMHSGDSSYKEDREIVIYCLNTIIYNNEDFFNILEEQSMFWNDSVEYVIEMVLKTLKNFTIGHDITAKLMPKFKNEIDADFSKLLLRKSILNREKYKKLVEENALNWDYDRLAYIDLLIIQLAITELITFPEIPTKVTFNEYIELSKIFSTPKSANFINGILDKIVQQLQKSGEINKVGRGLK